MQCRATEKWTRQTQHTQASKQTKQNQTRRAVCSTSGIGRFHVLVGRVPCHLVCRLMPAFFKRGFPTVPRPLPFPLDATHDGCVVLRTLLCLRLVPLEHEPCGCFEDRPVPLLTSLLQWAITRSQLQTPTACVP